MKIVFKNYKLLKLKQFLKSNKLFFLFNGSHKNSLDWLNTQQVFSNLNIKLNKISNRTFIKILQNSIYFKTQQLVSGPLFFITTDHNSKSIISKSTLIDKLYQFLFILLGLKLNNKIYSSTQIKKIIVLTYKENLLLNIKFLIAGLKKKLTSK